MSTATKATKPHARLISDLGGDSEVHAFITSRTGSQIKVDAVKQMRLRNAIPWRYRAPLKEWAEGRGVAVPENFL